MIKITVGGEEMTLTEESYQQDFFGKVSHINHGWVPGEDEKLPSFDPAPASVFSEEADGVTEEKKED